MLTKLPLSIKISRKNDFGATAFNVLRYVVIDSIPIEQVQLALQIIQKRHQILQYQISLDGKNFEKSQSLVINNAVLENNQSWHHQFDLEANNRFENGQSFLRVHAINQQKNSKTSNQFLFTMPHFLADGLSLHSIVKQTFEICNQMERGITYNQLLNQDINYNYIFAEQYLKFTLSDFYKGFKLLGKFSSKLQAIKKLNLITSKEALPFKQCWNGGIFKSFDGAKQFKEKCKQNNVTFGEAQNAAIALAAIDFLSRQNRLNEINGSIPLVYAQTISLRNKIQPLISEQQIGNFAAMPIYINNIPKEERNLWKVVQIMKNQQHKITDLQDHYRFMLVGKPMPASGFFTQTNFGVYIQNKEDKYHVKEMYSLAPMAMFPPVVVLQFTTIENKVCFSFSFCSPVVERKLVEEFADLVLHYMKEVQ